MLLDLLEGVLDDLDVVEVALAPVVDGKVAIDVVLATAKRMKMTSKDLCLFEGGISL